jgi:hypothetical protein
MKKKSRDEKARDKAIEKNSTRLAKFASVDDAEALAVHERTQALLNEKRQNMVQAIFDYGRASLALRKLVMKLERIESLLDEEIGKFKDGVSEDDINKSNIDSTRDDIGLPISIGEMKMEVLGGHAEVRLLSANVNKQLDSIKKTWGMTDEQVEKQLNDWILGKQKIY